MHREEGGGGKGDNSIGTAKGLSGGGGARVKGWCERPTCMSNPRILKESGRGCGIGVESYDRYSYIYTPFGPLKMERVHVGMPPSWSLHSPPFSTLCLRGIWTLLDSSSSRHTRNIFAPRFDEIKYNSFVSIHRDELFVPPFVRFHSLLSDYFLLLLASALQYRAVRCVCSFTYLERRWSNAEKKKNTLDSSDGEELSSRNFSLRNETEFLKIINNRPGGRGRIFNFNTSFFPSSPREEEAAAFLSPRHVADRLEIRRYKDTRRRFDDRKKPYTTKEKEREREVDLKDRCLRYRRGTKKPCGHENRLKHREAYREASHNLARQKDRAFVLPREKGAERGKNEMEEKRGEKEARVVWMRGWDKTGGERGFPRGSSPRSEVGVLIKPGSM